MQCNAIIPKGWLLVVQEETCFVSKYSGCRLSLILWTSGRTLLYVFINERAALGRGEESYGNAFCAVGWRRCFVAKV